MNAALYGLGLRVRSATEIFEKLSKRVFRGRNRFGIGYAAAAHSVIASYLQGRFPAKDIDDSLEEIFGDITTLDHRYMSSIGAKTGFPIVQLATSNTYLVTSYNGVDNGEGDNRFNFDEGSTSPIDTEKVLPYLALRPGNADIAVKDA